jgi:hypothetical protein
VVYESSFTVLHGFGVYAVFVRGCVWGMWREIGVMGGVLRLLDGCGWVGDVMWLGVWWCDAEWRDGQDLNGHGILWTLDLTRDALTGYRVYS